MTEKQEQSIGKDGTVSVTVMKTQVGTVKQDSEEREQITVTKFVTDPAYVGVSVGTTINMGNYESLRMEVRVTLPCYVEEVDEMYPIARKWADERLDREIADIRDKQKGI